MTNTFEISITAPDQTVFKGAVTMAVLPGSEGEFGVLPLHAAFATSLKEGVIKLYQGEKQEQAFPIKGGFAEVSNNQCLVLIKQ